MDKFNCKSLNLLKLFLTANASIKKNIIELADKDFLSLLVEIIWNTLNGDIEIVQKNLKSKLIKHKVALRAVGKTNKITIPLIRKQLLKLIGPLAICVKNFCSTERYKKIQQQCIEKAKNN